MTYIAPNMAAATTDTTPYLSSAGSDMNGFHQLVVHSSRTTQMMRRVHLAQGFNIALAPAQLPRRWEFQLIVCCIGVCDVHCVPVGSRLSVVGDVEIGIEEVFAVDAH